MKNVEKRVFSRQFVKTDMIKLKLEECAGVCCDDSTYVSAGRRDIIIRVDVNNEHQRHLRVLV